MWRNIKSHFKNFNDIRDISPTYITFLNPKSCDTVIATCIMLTGQ